MGDVACEVVDLVGVFVQVEEALLARRFEPSPLDIVERARSVGRAHRPHAFQILAIGAPVALGKIRMPAPDVLEALVANRALSVHLVVDAVSRGEDER